MEENEADEFSPFESEVDPDFEGIAVDEMATSLSSWVHHVPHILKQVHHYCEVCENVLRFSTHIFSVNLDCRDAVPG